MTTNNNTVYVLSLITVQHSSDHTPEQKNLGVFTSKANAAASAGDVETPWGTFNDLIAGTFSHNHVDNRAHPPEDGCLIQVGSREDGEGDFAKLVIEAFTVDNLAGTTAAAAGVAPASQRTNVTTSIKPDTSSSAKKPKLASQDNPREINETGLMALLQPKLSPDQFNRLNESIQQLLKEVESEAAPLRNSTEHAFGLNLQPENLFETSVGSFWGIFETRDYMRARLRLANHLHDKVALKYPTFTAGWQAVLHHYQEMLRLCSSDNLGLRYRFPFLLMHLQRDDDAVCFIRHWIHVEQETEDDSARYTKREKLHKASKEGDWLYGHEPDARFMDIFQACPQAADNCVCLPLLVALACIKMRNIAKADRNKELKQQQRTQLDRLIQIIHKDNPTMMPAMVNPRPLLSQKQPMYMSPGSPSECYSIVEDASLIWNEIPGALKRLQKQFGEKPQYNCNLEV